MREWTIHVCAGGKSVVKISERWFHITSTNGQLDWPCEHAGSVKHGRVRPIDPVPEDQRG